MITTLESIDSSLLVPVGQFSTMGEPEILCYMLKDHKIVLIKGPLYGWEEALEFQKSLFTYGRDYVRTDAARYKLGQSLMLSTMLMN